MLVSLFFIAGLSEAETYKRTDKNSKEDLKDPLIAIMAKMKERMLLINVIAVSCRNLPSQIVFG